MSEKTEINYEQVQAIAKKFQVESDAINQLLSQTKGKVEELHGSGWIGAGSDKFFEEMEGLVLPSMVRLVRALQEAAGVANQIIGIYQQAEATSQGSFKSFTV